MLKKIVLISSVLLLLLLLVTYCNLPQRTTPETNVPTPTSTLAPIFDTSTPELLPAISTPTEVPSICENLYQPSKLGDTWSYTGSNTALSSYERTDTISKANGTSFTSQNTIESVTYTVDYTCTEQGLIADNPVQQYLGALLNSPNTPIKVKLISVTGISLPKDIKAGDEWQQVAEVEADINGTKTDGWLVFDYHAVGIESISVPAGSFDALRVDANIKIEATPLRLQAGSYVATIWMAPQVGVIKTEGISHVPGIEFTDNTVLASFSNSQ